MFNPPPINLDISIGDRMKKTGLTIPEIAMIAGTRVIAGVALLLADKLDMKRRKKLGWAMFLVGAISTIPLAIDVFSKRK